MAEQGRYCKAYLLKDMRAYDCWKENSENARPENEDPWGTDSDEPVIPRTLTDESIVYLQENYVVTDEIYKDEHILFDDVTDDWKKFCGEALEFKIPDYDDEAPVASDEKEEEEKKD